VVVLLAMPSSCFIDERQIAAWMKHVTSVPGVGGTKR
jgi:hypothetical protein